MFSSHVVSFHLSDDHETSCIVTTAHREWLLGHFIILIDSTPTLTSDSDFQILRVLINFHVHIIMQPLDSRPHSCLAMQCRIPQVTLINVDISHFQCDKINVFKLVCLVTTLSTSWQRKTGSAAERAKPPPPPVWPLHWPPGGGGIRPCLRGRSTIRSAAPRARVRQVVKGLTRLPHLRRGAGEGLPLYR